MELQRDANIQQEQMREGNALNTTDRLERLQERVRELQRESVYRDFTDYLAQMQTRVSHQQRQIDLLAAELEKRYQMYQMNLQTRQKSQPVPQPMRPEPVQTVNLSAPQQVVPQNVIPQQTVPQNVIPQQTVPQNPVPQQVIPQNTVLQQTMPQMPEYTQKQPRRNVEFTIGAAVLSIIGSVFIFAALTLLGIHYMNGFVKGMTLYGISLLVLALAEALLYKKWPGIGTTLSALGMGGLYLSTVLNYLVLRNFNIWVAAGLFLAVTIFVYVLSKKRNSVAYRILGMAASYICTLVITAGWVQETGLAPTGYFAITVILFAMNLVCLLLPVYKFYTVINVTHIALNTLFTMLICLMWKRGSSWTSFGHMWHYPAFLAISLLMMQVIFIAQIRWKMKQKPDGYSLADNTGICTAYGISAFFYMVMTMRMTDFANLIAGEEMLADAFMIHRLVCAAAVVLICIVPLVVLKKRQEKWLAWYLLNPLLLAIYMGAGAGWEKTVCLAILIAVSKGLSFKKTKMLHISDALLTAFACLTVLIEYKQTYSLLLFAVLLVSVLCIYYWQTYYEIILSFTIALFTSLHMLPILKLPVFVGIMFVGMLIFNNVGRWRGRNVLIYNGFAVATQTVCYVLLMQPLYYREYFTCLCMLIFGVSTIVICFQEKYKMNFELRRIILVFFLTYMVIFIQTSYPVINSILMMVIAVISVWLGFAEHRKEVRIYGLALSFIVCAKIVFYDFSGASVLQRTILFFVIGVLALAISAIYMVLEKRFSDKKAESDHEVIQEAQTEE